MIFSRSFVAFVALSLSSLYATAIELSAEDFVKQRLDYLIVGGGTSGLVVAARLSENPRVKVGVIEAGYYHVNDPLIDDPHQYGPAAGNPDYDWAYYTIPQVGCKNRTISENRGKVVGGSSALNAFAYHRPSAAEFDNWGSKFGNGDLWSWKNVAPFFKKAENWLGPPPLVYPGAEESDTIGDAHRQGGPLTIGYNNWYGDSLLDAAAATQNLGWFLNNDPDNGNGTGFQNVPRTIDPITGKRTHSGSAYWEPYSHRRNYMLMARSTATKINFDRSERQRHCPRDVDAQQDASGERCHRRLKATGVTFVNNGTEYTVNAREIIISGGTINTPQLLELSGIGDKNILEPMGIEPVLNLPYVGENFFDHTVVFSDSINHDGQVTLDMLHWNETYAAEQLAIYEESHTGPLSYSSAAIGVMPAQSWVSPEVLEQLKATLNPQHRTPLAKLQYEENLELLEEGKVGWGMLISWPGGSQASRPADGKTYFGHHVLNYRPFARGSIHINTTNYLDHPLIDPGFMSTDFDAKFCAHQLNWTQTLTKTAPLSDVVAAPNSPPADKVSLEDLEDYCRSRAITTWHPMGSAAMAPYKMGGVVSNKLIVHGTSNLRIADCSIIPQAIGAAPQGTAYMIGEKAADIIKRRQ